MFQGDNNELAFVYFLRIALKKMYLSIRNKKKRKLLIIPSIFLCPPCLRRP